MRRIAIAGLAVLLCAMATPARLPASDQAERDGARFTQRIREADAERQICAVDRLAESRMPRTVCRTAREWRERAFRDFRKQ